MTEQGRAHRATCAGGPSTLLRRKWGKPAEHITSTPFEETYPNFSDVFGRWFGPYNYTRQVQPPGPYYDSTGKINSLNCPYQRRYEPSKLPRAPGRVQVLEGLGRVRAHEVEALRDRDARVEHRARLRPLLHLAGGQSPSRS